MRHIATLALIALLATASLAHARTHRSFAAKHKFWVATGHPHGWPGHVVDHVVPLACGGADAPSNMQWQTIEDAKAKDRWERRECHAGQGCCH